MTALHRPEFARRADLLDAGISASVLRSGDEHSLRPFHGAYSTGRMAEAAAPRWADETWHRTAQRLAGLQAVRPDALADGFTAAALLGLALPAGAHRTLSEEETVPLDVLVPERAGRVRRRGVRSRRSQVYAAQTRFGLHIAAGPIVLAGLARRIDHADLVAMMDGVVGGWRTGAGVPIAQLTSAVRSLPAHTRGRSSALRALDDVRAGVDSPQETHLRLAAVAAGLPEPAVHPAVSLRSGIVVHPDLGYPLFRVGLEYEGEGHLISPKQYERDIRRYEDLAEAGWTIIRVTKLSSLPERMEAVREALIRNGWRPGSNELGTV